MCIPFFSTILDNYYTVDVLRGCVDEPGGRDFARKLHGWLDDMIPGQPKYLSESRVVACPHPASKTCRTKHWKIKVGGARTERERIGPWPVTESVLRRPDDTSATAVTPGRPGDQAHALLDGRWRRAKLLRILWSPASAGLVPRKWQVSDGNKAPSMVTDLDADLASSSQDWKSRGRIHSSSQDWKSSQDLNATISPSMVMPDSVARLWWRPDREG